jgi:Protein of unknown function (DUF4238)
VRDGTTDFSQMLQSGNQHFVPQYYFRLFSEGRHSINLILASSGRTIINASIKGQCASRNFYGSADIEEIFAGMEGKHAEIIRKLSSAAWNRKAPELAPEDVATLWEAVIFQRSRTALQIDKSKDVLNAMALPGFRAYIALADHIEDRERVLNSIDKGEMRIAENPIHAVLQAIEIGLDGVGLISDLGLCILRNHTPYPFIFSDSPVVFCNTLLRDVTRRGALGLQSSGLQIFYPLSPNLALMMFDEDAYKIPDNFFIDVTERADISQMNALQMQHSLNAVYFGDAASEEYVSNLWHAHRKNVENPKAETRVLRDVEVMGETVHSFIQTLEPHLKVRLDLSFVSCNPVAEREYRLRHRNPQLVAEHKERIKQREAGKAERTDAPDGP